MRCVFSRNVPWALFPWTVNVRGNKDEAGTKK